MIRASIETSRSKLSNVEFTERFTREARTIAALNHTNICHLYDVAPNYLVMEDVEGETLHGPIRSATRCRSCARSSTASKRRTRRASSIAISNPPTSRSRLPAW